MAEDHSSPNPFHIRLMVMIAHDVKVPLENILLLLELYKKSPETVLSDLDEFLKTLKIQVKASHTLFTELLEWSKTHLLRQSQTTGAFNLKKITDEVIKFVEFQNLKKNIKFFNNIGPELALQSQFREIYKFVLRNLLINSIKFSYPNGTCRIEARQESNNYFISIKDEGVGLYAEQIEGIFNSKTNSQAGTSGEQGSGLGLLLCRDCLAEVGGNLNIESQPGQGAIFSFSIPAISVN